MDFFFGWKKAMTITKQTKWTVMLYFSRHVTYMCMIISFSFQGWEFAERLWSDTRTSGMFPCFPCVPALVVMATVSRVTQEKIFQNLGLRQPSIIISHRDRQNIMYYKQERLHSTQKQDDLDKFLLRDWWATVGISYNSTICRFRGH